MRLRFHSSLVLMAMMTLPFEGECVQLSLGSINANLSNQVPIELAQIGQSTQATDDATKKAKDDQ